MKKLYILLLLINSVTLNSCKHTSNKSLSNTTIYLDSIRKDVHYWEVFDEINYVVLHGMPSDEPIAEIEKIFKFENGYICWDEQRSAVYVFDNRGKYVRHIRAIGGGPKEYIEIGDMCFNEVDQCIYVIDRASYLLKYTLNGEGTDKVLLPKLASNLIADLNGNILLYSNPKERKGVMDQCVLWYLNENGTTDCVIMNDNTINTFYLISEFKFSKSSNSKNLLFTVPYSNYIYSVYKGHLNPKYRIDLGKRKYLNSKDITEMTFYEQLDYRNGPEQMTFPLGHIFSLDSWIATWVFLKFDIGLWNKPTNYHAYEYILFNPDFGTYSSHNLIDDDKNYFYWRIKGSFDNTLIHHLYYQDVERIIEEKIDLRTEDGGKVLDQLDATSEVLMLMKLKTDPST